MYDILLENAIVYNRVSTQKEAQTTSIEYQEEEGYKVAKELGCKNIRLLTERYSGTFVEKRKEYLEMIEAMKNDEVDIIIVKDTDRLNRNEKEWYTIRDLSLEHNVKIYFYLDKKFYREEDNLIYGIKATLDAEYSRKLSKNINKAHRKRQLEGDKVTLDSNTFGYVYENGKIVVDEEEAKLIVYMYDLALQGHGVRTIANILTKEGYTNRNGKRFGTKTIYNILRNPLRTGTMIMNKEHYNFYSKKREKVDPSEWIIRDGIVPQIVSKEIWEKVNGLIDSRRSEAREDRKTGKHLGTSLLSNKLFCGYCDSVFYRASRDTKKRGQVFFWTCKKQYEEGRLTSEAIYQERKKVKGLGCDNVRLEEEVIYKFIKDFYKEHFIINADLILQETITVLKQALYNINCKLDVKKETDKINRQLSEIEEKENALYESMLVYKNVKQEIADRLLKNYEAEREALHNKISELEKQEKNKQSIEQRIINIEQVLKDTLIEEASLQTIISYIDKIIIYVDKLEIKFNLAKVLNLDIDNIEQSYTIPLREFAMEYKTENIKHTRELVYSIIKENPQIAFKDLMRQTGLASTTLTVRIRDLKKAGRIARNRGESAYRILE